MKQAICLLSILTFSQALFAQWEFVNEHVGIFEQAQFINENTGFITGNNIFFKTKDGGQQWQTIPLDPDIEFYKFCILTESAILALGTINSYDSTHIFRSDNGGVSWQKKGSFPGKYRDQDWFLISDSLYYISVSVAINDTTAEQRIYKTINAGTTWENITPLYQELEYENLQIVSNWFINETTGFLVVDNTKGLNYDERMSIEIINIVFRTINGGATWQEQITDLNDIRKLQFINDSTGYFIAANNDVQSFYETTDTFKTWIAWYNIKPNESLESYGFQSADSLYSVIGYKSPEFDWLNDSMLLKRSLDRGKSWEKIQTLDFSLYWAARLNEVQFAGNNGFIIVNAGNGDFGSSFSTLLKSNQNGNNWQISLISYPFAHVSFFDDYTGFASGGASVFHGIDFGDIFKTTDGGNSWKLYFSRGGPVGKLQFVNHKTGYAILNDRNEGMLKTSDGGNTWALYKSFNDTLVFSISSNDILFNDENIGWLAGSYMRYGTSGSGAAIFHTINGGESWERLWHKPSSPSSGENVALNSIYLDNSKLWTVGNQGLLVNSDDLETFNTINIGTSLPLNDVFYIDWGHLWITGGFGSPGDDEFQSVLIRSINNGATWETYHLSEFAIRDLYFETSHHGWAVGTNIAEKGIILETFDGGENWTVQLDELPYSMQTLTAKKGYLWAIGDNGILLRYKLANWIESAPDLSSPDNLTLQQNYPNPFRQKTTICYQISESTSIELSIYNQLGQKISVLDSGTKPPGDYRVDFNASDLEAGIYYCKLETGKGVSEIRKLILLY